MDGTLIRTKSGRLHPINRGDWVWWHESVPKKLRGLHSGGYKIVIFTNQAGIAKGRTAYSTIAGKIKDLSTELGFPIQAFIAGDTNQYRKPHARMWEEMAGTYNGGVEIQKAFYVGDAAGRPKSKDRPKRDFACSDRSFAYNAKIMFYTPEEFFLKSAPEKFLWGGLDPEKLLRSCTDDDDGHDDDDGKKGEDKRISPATEQEVVVLVGPPASGKSRMAKSSLSTYTWVNRDTLKTAAKCIKAAKQAVEDGRSVVVDNTSPSGKSRAAFIEIAQSHGIKARCWEIVIPRNLAEHLNFVREAYTDGARRRVPSVAYNMFYKNYQQPSATEGFDSVTRSKFKLDVSGDAKLEKCFRERSG
mmetsp:Transcript_23892/g.33421  ORF Transcript_23892/g.33421 Transcript_23892/m.33421 type:complete len:358 (-) Transcript_23892:249-1322(-)